MDSLQKQIKRHTKMLKKISTVEVPRAAASALNKSAQKAQTAVVRHVAKSKKIPQKIIRKKMFISRAKPQKQRARMYAYSRDVKAISLLKTATILKHVRRGTNRRGVRVAGRQFDGAFINVHRQSGRFQVFQRQGAKRTPIDVVGIEVEGALERAIEGIADTTMKNDFPVILERELQFRFHRITVR